MNRPPALIPPQYAIEQLFDLSDDIIITNGALPMTNLTTGYLLPLPWNNTESNLTATAVIFEGFEITADCALYIEA